MTLHPYLLICQWLNRTPSDTQTDSSTNRLRVYGLYSILFIMLNAVRSLISFYSILLKKFPIDTTEIQRIVLFFLYCVNRYLQFGFLENLSRDFQLSKSDLCRQRKNVSFSTINPNIMNFVFSYFSVQIFSLKHETTGSSPNILAADVPQNSLLTPSLHSIYVYNLPETPQGELVIYADDAAVYIVSKSAEIIYSRLQNLVYAIKY